MRRFLFSALAVLATLTLISLVAPSLAQGDPTATPAAQRAYADLTQVTTVAGFPVLGNPEAALIIAEFSNFSCPGCALYRPTIKQIIEAHVRTGKARFMFLPMVFGLGDDPSFLAAQAALCAGRQNAFWEMHDALFDQHNAQGAQSFNPTTLRAAAEKLALDADQLIACVETGATTEVILSAARFAEQTGIRFTPTLMWSIDDGRTLQWFTQADGTRYESGVPFEDVDALVARAVSGELSAAIQATGTALAQITPTAVPTKSDPFANLTFEQWRSSDGLLSLEFPRGWRAQVNVQSVSPISYIFTPADDESLGVGVLITPTKDLGIPDLAPNTTPAELAQLVFGSQPGAQIREVAAGRNGEYRGVGIRQTQEDVNPRTGQRLTIERDIWILALDPVTLIVMQGVSASEFWANTQKVFEQATKTIAVEREGALLALERVFNPTPTFTPTFNATADFIDRATATALQFVPFRSADGAISFDAPQTWRVEPNFNSSPVAYNLLPPDAPLNNVISLSVRTVSSLGVPSAGENADALTLMREVFGRDPKYTIEPVTANALKGAGVVQYESVSDRVSGGYIDLERRIWLLDVAPGYVLLIQAVSAPAQRVQVTAVFERLTQSLVLDAALSVAAIEARLNAPPTTPTPVPTVAGFAPVALGEGACVGVKDPENVEVPADGRGKQYSAPEQVINPAHTYCAILTTAKGRIVVQLYPQVAPQHVNSFVFLAQRGFYDGTTFHRVIPGFVAQGGDPTGTGTGGAGYTLPLELYPTLKYDRVGVLGMARASAPNSASSQFFITYAPLPSLDPSAQNAGYTIFGQVVEGMDVVEQIAPRDPSSATSEGDLLISVRIVDLGVR
jgi:peptidylprolyl isomerase